MLGQVDASSARLRNAAVKPILSLACMSLPLNCVVGLQQYIVQLVAQKFDLVKENCSAEVF